MTLIEAKDNILINKQFDEFGNLAFGIHEYIDIPGIEYDPKIGIMGLEQYGAVTEMKHLCVHPDYRKRGLGKKLLEKGIEAAQTEFVFGGVRNDNHSNIRNNLRIGMRPIGKKRGRGCQIIIFARRKNGHISHRRGFHGGKP